jgi:hypothetical protein
MMSTQRKVAVFNLYRYWLELHIYVYKVIMESKPRSPRQHAMLRQLTGVPSHRTASYLNE